MFSLAFKYPSDWEGVVLFPSLVTIISELNVSTHRDQLRTAGRSEGGSHHRSRLFGARRQEGNLHKERKVSGVLSALRLLAWGSWRLAK